MLQLLAKIPKTAKYEKVFRKNTSKLLLKVLLLILVGYIIGSLRDPFLLIFYSQIAFLFMIVLIIKIRRRNSIFLPSLILFIVFFALNKKEISVALGLLCLVIFIGGNLIKVSQGRRIVYFSSAILIVSIFIFYFILSHTSAQPHTTTDQSSKLEAIKSFPYLSHVDDEGKRREGVVEANQNLCAPGLNFYNSYYKAGAYLLDMTGNILHKWLPPKSHPNWQYVTVCENGDLLVCIEDVMLMRLNWDSQIRWQKEMRAHHDIAVAENKDIYVLASSEEVVFIDFVPVPIINDYVVILSSDGMIKKKISVFKLLKKDLSLLKIIKIYSRILDPKDFLWRGIKSKLTKHFLLQRMTPFDVFHSNSITIIDKNIEGICKKGDALISMRSLNRVGIVDLDLEKMKWTWGPGDLEEQHNPTFLENGNILIFDNGTKRKYSRLIELDPHKNRIAWEYPVLRQTPFFTSWGGSAQRLPNGNTLITETSKGRVFEITKDGKIVWEFFNPDKGENGNAATIYRMTRISDAHLLSMLLKNLKIKRQ